MTLRLELADLGLPALDALDVDAVAVFVGPERPLQGLAGYADWRLCGALSRAIRADYFGAQRGEVLLLPSGGRLGPKRIFCFGVGDRALRADELADVCGWVCDTLERAASTSFATSFPAFEGDGGLATRGWLEANARFAGRKVVLLGEPRTLQRDLSAAKEALACDIEIVVPQVRVELPRRGPALPQRSAVVR
jgi:hypothetical protein